MFVGGIPFRFEVNGNVHIAELRFAANIAPIHDSRRDTIAIVPNCVYFFHSLQQSRDDLLRSLARHFAHGGGLSQPPAFFRQLEVIDAPVPRLLPSSPVGVRKNPGSLRKLYVSAVHKLLYDLFGLASRHLTSLGYKVHVQHRINAPQHIADIDGGQSRNLDTFDLHRHAMSNLLSLYLKSNIRMFMKMSMRPDAMLAEI